MIRIVGPMRRPMTDGSVVGLRRASLPTVPQSDTYTYVCVCIHMYIIYTHTSINRP